MNEPKKKPAKKKFIDDYRKLRRSIDLSQTEFWGRLGVTQSCGCRYESGKTNVPRPVATLAHAVYIEGIQINAQEYK